MRSLRVEFYLIVFACLTSCMVKDGSTRALGDIDYSVARKYVQRSTREPEWSSYTAFQFRLLANMQRYMKRKNCTLEEFLNDHMDLNQQSRIRAIRVMLQMNFSDVCRDADRWMVKHPDGVSGCSASVQPPLIFRIVEGLYCAPGTEPLCKEAASVR